MQRNAEDSRALHACKPVHLLAYVPFGKPTYQHAGKLTYTKKTCWKSMLVRLAADGQHPGARAHSKV